MPAHEFLQSALACPVARVKGQAVLGRMWALAVEVPACAAGDETLGLEFRECSRRRVLRTTNPFSCIASGSMSGRSEL
jgi:hypothetical protein